MAEEKHLNLFTQGDKVDVYAAFQRDYHRDVLAQSLWQLVFLAFALGGIFIAGHKEWIWLFGALFAVERSIYRFIDNSNRNWAMHVIDWIQHSIPERND